MLCWPTFAGRMAARQTRTPSFPKGTAPLEAEKSEG
jgi:hypothetical protein